MRLDLHITEREENRVIELHKSGLNNTTISLRLSIGLSKVGGIIRKYRDANGLGRLRPRGQWGATYYSAFDGKEIASQCRIVPKSGLGD